MLAHLAHISLSLSLIINAGCAADMTTFHDEGLQAAVTRSEPFSVGIVQFPSISPDGQTIIYSWAGDLWAVDAKGGLASRLTSHPAIERRSAFSPDGKTIAFDSEREGGRNLFTAPLVRSSTGAYATGAIRRITYIDRPQQLSAFTPDGSALLLWGSLDPSIYRMTKMYRVPLDAGDTPAITKITEAFGNSPRYTLDGKNVLFTQDTPEQFRPKYRGSGTTDVWSMNLADGSFKQVSTNPATDFNAFPCADGSVVFISSRDGTNNLWRIAPGATDEQAKQLTNFAPSTGELTIAHGVRDLNVNPSGTVAVFCVWDTLYTLDLTRTGAAPKAVTIYASPDQAEMDFQRLNLSKEITETALSPDGKTIAMIARGEVFVRSTEEGRPTRRVTFTAGRERGLAWSPDNRVLWFASDESGTSKLYYATVTLAREDLTPKTETDDKPADEEKKDEKKPAADAADKRDEKKDDAPAEGEKKPAVKKIDYAKRWSDALRFEVKQLDTGPSTGANDGMLGIEDQSPTPSPDGRQLLFTRGRGDLMHIDLRTKKVRKLLSGWNEPEADWAADSRHIVFAREDLDFNSDIFILDTQAKEGTPEAEPRNITRHPDNDDNPRLSADGKVLFFRSDRDGDSFQYQIYYVFLDKKLEGLRPFELEDYFKKAAEAAKKKKPIEPVLWDGPEPVKAEAKAEPKPEAEKMTPVPPATEVAGSDKKDEKKDEPADKKPDAPKPAPRRIAKKPEPMKFDTDDAYLRIRRFTTNPGNKSSLAITPAADRVLFVGSNDPEPALFSVTYKNDDRKVVQAGAVSDVRVSLTGDRVTFIRQGNAFGTVPAGGKVDAYPIDAPIVLDVAAQERQKFNEFARVMGNGFYHPTLKGLDWRGLTARYIKLAEKARNNDEFNRVCQMMLGELDGSHTGVTGGPGAFTAPSVGTGYLGINATIIEIGAKVTRVIAGSPADRDQSRLEVGDVITHVDGEPVILNAKPRDLAALLAGKAGKDVLLDLTRADGAKPKQVLIVPIAAPEDVDLRYKDEVLRRAAQVEKLSGGKLGYLHIRAMSEPSVRDFERDLYAAAHGKEGLVIDVRDNGGGSTADILLASLTAPNHAYTIPRGADPATVAKDAYPRDRRLIYGYVRPINVLINQHSFSNAEIFSHAIKTIGRGKLIGTATFGGVISTGAMTLIDGTSVRTPFRGWYLPDGRDQENNGAQPDINVPQLPTDEAAGVDRQLEAAVNELLGRVGAGK